MPRIILFALLIVGLSITPGRADQAGMISVKSSHSVADTADRLVNILAQKGMQVFLRVNHAEGAENNGIALRPTELVVFGNPKVGAPLMENQQTIGIDLPQKMLIWQDASEQVWLTYNDPDYLATRHGIEKNLAPLQKVHKAMAAFAQQAGAP